MSAFAQKLKNSNYNMIKRKHLLTENEFLEKVKSFCSNNSFTFVGHINVGKSILILILGSNCTDALKQFLKDLDVEHTLPCKMAEGIGSYITL